MYDQLTQPFSDSHLVNQLGTMPAITTQALEHNNNSHAANNSLPSLTTTATQHSSHSGLACAQP